MSCRTGRPTRAATNSWCVTAIAWRSLRLANKPGCPILRQHHRRRVRRKPLPHSKCHHPPTDQREDHRKAGIQTPRSGRRPRRAPLPLLLLLPLPLPLPLR
jgi:hypothetical protein